MLRVEAADDFEEDDISNLFCVDKDGKDYNVAINVGTNESYTYYIEQQSKTANVQLNEESIEDICKKIANRRRKIKNQGLKKNKFEFSLNNLYVDADNLFFIFQLQNKSNIRLRYRFCEVCFY